MSIIGNALLTNALILLNNDQIWQEAGITLKNLDDYYYRWNKYASVRAIPRRTLEGGNHQKFFPISRQPLAIHPRVAEKNNESMYFILTQSAYRYLHEIAIQEIVDVNEVALNIVNRELDFSISDDDCRQALSVIVDEAYHAYTAFDSIAQISEFTKIKPLPLTSLNPISRAFNTLEHLVSAEDLKMLQFIAVCLSEHVLTKDLVYLNQEPDVSNFFNEIMRDHLLDEGRHASFFSKLLQSFWKNNTQEHKKTIIAQFIPKFIDAYIDNTSQKEFDALLLKALNFSLMEIEEILFDTHFETDKNKNMTVGNFMKVLRKTGLLNNQIVVECFKTHGFNID